MKHLILTLLLAILGNAALYAQPDEDRLRGLGDLQLNEANAIEALNTKPFSKGFLKDAWRAYARRVMQARRALGYSYQVSNLKCR